MANVPISNPGFETGDFTGWTTQHPTETSVQSAVVNSGGFAAELTDSNVDTGGAAYQAFTGGVTYGAGKDLYVRAFFSMHNNGGTNWDFGILVLGNNSANMNGIDFRTDVPGTNQVIRMFDRSTGVWSPDGTFAIQYDTWYRVEMHVAIVASGVTTGLAELRLYNLAGTLLDSIVWAGIDSSAGTNPYAAVGIGPQGGGGSGLRTFDIFLDDIAIDDATWVGPIGGVAVPQKISVSADDQWLGGDYY